jgi:hypothetical protein
LILREGARRRRAGGGRTPEPHAQRDSRDVRSPGVKNISKQINNIINLNIYNNYRGRV